MSHAFARAANTRFPEKLPMLWVQTTCVGAGFSSSKAG